MPDKNIADGGLILNRSKKIDGAYNKTLSTYSS